MSTSILFILVGSIIMGLIITGFKTLFNKHTEFTDVHRETRAQAIASMRRRENGGK